MTQQSFESIAQQILKHCEELYWHVPNNVKQEQIHVKTWHVPETTARYLHKLILDNKAKQILELGTSAGYSTVWLADAVKLTGGHVDTIEYFDEKVIVAREHFKLAQLEQYITLHHDQIINVLEQYDKPLDFIFMDADRGNYDKYFYYLYPLLKKGGMIVVDNAGNYRDRMQRFLQLCDQSPHEKSEFIDLDNGLFIYKK